jgi:putative DNA primase/helicase
MTRDANDVHRELGIDGLREIGDSLPDLDFKEPVPKVKGNGREAPAAPAAEEEVADYHEEKATAGNGAAAGDAAEQIREGDGAAHDDDFSGPGKVDLEIVRLAKLPVVDYERTRQGAASKLGIRIPALDRLVAARRPDRPAPGKGHPLELPAPDPWPWPVDGAALVAELKAAIRKYVVLTENDALTVALWVLHTYCFDAFPCTPRLAITAPEKRCGKTTLLDVIGLLVPRPLSTANISAAATFRTIEAVRPTLLIDEADAFLSENEELRGILNSGHRKGGQVIRTVGDDFEARAFSTHTPLAIAQIGKLPDTLAYRSVHISMKRRLLSEGVARFCFGRTGDLSEVARKAARWVADNADAIRECDPNIPDAIFNRAADNWAPLLAVAEVAGSAVATLGRHVALASCGIEEELSPRAMLLTDIRDAFASKNCDRISSDELVAYLTALEERPWPECNHGKPITKAQLARRLKPFGLTSKVIRTAAGTPRGYMRDDFNEACSRYLPPSFQSATPQQMNDFNLLREKQTATGISNVVLSKSRNTNGINDVADVAPSNPPDGKNESVADFRGTESRPHDGESEAIIDD